jgi:diguanylate cyclase (GGDEF)-like protein
MPHPRTFELPTEDKLTGLLNEPYFRYMLREQLIPAAQAADEPLVLALIDLDRLMAMNAEHGPDCADGVIKGTARVLRETLPEGAYLFRYGGDEFAALLPGMRLDDAFSLLDTFRRALAGTVFTEGACGDLRITASIGLAAYPNDATNPVELLRAADHAVYVAKQTGANKVALPLQDNRMITKTSHYTATQLKRLRELAEAVGKSDAILLREALDDLLKKYNDQLKQRPA